MFDHEDDIVERVIRQLRRPVSMDPSLDARVMDAIIADPRQQAPPRPVRRVWPWLAVAAALTGLLVARPWSRGAASPDAFQFVLVAPQAATVSLVGDSNDWDPARAPMRTAHGVWATVVPLHPGRYRYAFLVNGVEWRADPAAPHAIDDEFGTPSSVVTVGGKGS
ncbi:MAG: isoamylase early set domain-containing protein [Gemmatimonadales bacterium]